jgi:NADPH:quinone reductase-like Zn-dependent oxidoreductase
MAHEALVEPNAERTTMKAVVYDRYGPPEVLALRDVEKPTPDDDEVLIKVRATTVTYGDHRARSLDVPAGFGPVARLAMGVFGPRQKILGTELAGDVEAVGKNVRAFEVGDAILAFGAARMGCHAEYRCMRADGALALKPANLTYEEAAALPFGGLTALHFLHGGNVQAGETVLVNGASGAVGTACVQLARHLGAEVTAVCSAANAELVRSLGAAHVVDYMREDFTKNGRTYDVIVDAAGTSPFSRCEASLAEQGRLLLVVASLADALRIPCLSMTSKKRILAGVALGSGEELRFLAGLAAAGELKPVVDRRYRFEQIVEAHRYVDTGRKKGAVVLTLGA